MYLADRAREPTDSAIDRPGRRTSVSSVVVLLGVVSLLTDISSEAVNAVLPLYIVATLGMSPLAYGLVDGVYQGVSAVVRLFAAQVADRLDRPKWVAFAGYLASALARLALIPSNALAALTAVVTADRLGKGIRTAPRDAMIAMNSAPESTGRSFGVHRAFDTFGAMVGPLIAAVILWYVPGDYRTVFLVSLIFAVMGLIVLGLLVPDVRPRAAQLAELERQAAQAHRNCQVRCRDCSWSKALADARTSGGSTRILSSVWRDAKLRRLATVAGSLGLFTVGDGFIYLVLQRHSDFAAAYFPLLLVGTNLAYLVLAIPLGGAADRVGRRRVFLLGHVALIAALLLASSGLAGLFAVLSTLALLGVYYAATDGVMAAWAARLAPANGRTSGLALVQTGSAAARFCSSLMFGALWTVIGPERSLLVFAGALAAMLIVAVPATSMVDGGPDMSDALPEPHDVGAAEEKEH